MGASAGFTNRPTDALIPAVLPARLPRLVLMTADTIGGIWTYALELAAGLGRFGVHVALATMGRPASDEQRREAAALPHVTLHEGNYKLEWMEEPWQEVEAAGKWLLGLADRLKPDVVHLNGYTHAALPWRCPTVVVAHSCCLSWWAAVRGDREPAPFDRYREKILTGLAAADLVIAPTAAMLERIEQIYLPLGNRRVIHNGRSRALFYPGKKADFIFCVGRVWDEAKNVATVARASHSVSWPIYVAGEEQHPEGGAVALRNLKPLGFLPPQKLASWFATAAIYVHPARYEPFGLTVLEAALSGCALVLGDIPSLRELWHDAAVFVPPDDDWELTRSLRALYRDRGYREEMAARACEAAGRYSSERMTAEYLNAYGSLLPDRHPRNHTTLNERKPDADRTVLSLHRL